MAGAPSIPKPRGGPGGCCSSRDWVEALDQQGYSVTTVRVYRLALLEFAEWVEARPELTEAGQIGREALASYSQPGQRRRLPLRLAVRRRQVRHLRLLRQQPGRERHQQRLRHLIRDLLNGTTTRVSVDSNGTQGDLDSFSPVLTADGRFVSFDSAATNLVANDTNGVNDLFIHDRNSGQTARVSVDANGVQGNNTSVFGYMSPDGTAVSFDSEASNLVPNDTNGVRDIFLAPNPLD